MTSSTTWAPAWREQTWPGTAWGNYLEHIAPGSGARAVGHREDGKGAQAAEQTRQRPDVLEALRHLSRRCFQLPDVRATRLIRSQKSAGSWPGCTRSPVIWRFPRGPSDVHHVHLDGVKFDARQLVGEQRTEVRIIQFILSDEPLPVPDRASTDRLMIIFGDA